MLFIKKFLKLIKFIYLRKTGLFYNKFQDELYNFQQNYLRGSYKEIKSRQNEYIPFVQSLPLNIKNKNYFLDVGCGRGEFLEILKEIKIKKIIGIDTNKESVIRLQKKSFNVKKIDVLKYLYLTENKFCGISAFHIIEHLTFKQLFDFLILARDTLVKGGVLILETPNIENIIVSSLTFNYDHTHKLKVPKIIIQMLLEYIGFSKIKFLYLHPAKKSNKTQVDKLIYGARDLGIIAYK
jgi:O-antigen chain-terminating methyltransferase